MNKDTRKERRRSSNRGRTEESTSSDRRYRAHLPERVLLVLGVLLISAASAGEPRALLIGINDYLANDAPAAEVAGQPWIPEDLNGARNDIALMRRLLVSRFGFPEKNIRMLEDQAATREGILSALSDFVASTSEDDVVYIHFSGHGSQVDDLNGDEEDRLDETILPFDARTGSVPDITDDELNAILSKLKARNSLVVLDSCHSGTATRGGNLLKTRSVPLDPRGGLYSPAALPEGEASYILMTGAADYQSALDGPIDRGRYYGLFTWSLAASLGRTPDGASAEAIHAEARKEMQRVGQRFGLYSVPESQIEGDTALIRSGLLTEAGSIAAREVARRPWAMARPAGDSIRLEGAASLGAQPDAIWAVYGESEREFAPSDALFDLRITHVEGLDAFAVPITGSATDFRAGRAIAIAAAPPPPQVTIRLDEVDAAVRQDLASRLTAAGIRGLRLVEEGEFARFIVDYVNGFASIYGAGGLQEIDTFRAPDVSALVDRLRYTVRRSRNIDDLLSLDNPASALNVSVKVNPVDRFGGVRGVQVVGAEDVSAYRIRGRDEPRDRSNSLQLEIDVSDDSYLTIVDIDPEGSIGVLFPNSISERRKFHEKGFVAGGGSIRIPDALEDNRAGFYWDFAAPAGIDTIRVFAARDLQTAEAIRQYIGELAVDVTKRGGSAAQTGRDALFVASPAISTRGVAIVSEDAGAPAGGRPDWAAATVTFVVED